MSEPRKEPYFHQLLRHARQMNCSDIHVASGEPPVLRLQGSLKRMNMGVLTTDQITTAVNQLLDQEDAVLRKRLLEEKSCDFAVAVPGTGRFRVNVFNTDEGLSVSFRYIPERVQTLAEISAPAAFLKLAELHRGLVLVTGPTGSGKSTTLAALIDLINQKRAAHVITLEDPIEFKHTSKRSLIQQREIGPHSPHFQRGLRDALRQDPDVILVGEMRDLETTRIALSAAETGHLVLATLHTRNVPSTIERVIEQFPEGEKDYVKIQLAASLAAIVTQALVPTIDGKRIAVHEVLIVDQPARSMIAKGTSSQQLRGHLQTRGENGSQTMDVALSHYVATKVIDHVVALDLAQNTKEFESRVNELMAGRASQELVLVKESDLPISLGPDIVDERGSSASGQTLGDTSSDASPSAPPATDGDTSGGTPLGGGESLGGDALGGESLGGDALGGESLGGSVFDEDDEDD